MPFERHITEGAGALLDQMGALLQRPRDIAILIAERYRFEPAFRSQAEADLAETIFPEKYNNALLHQPRLTASLYLRSGSDHLAGLGALFREREIPALLKVQGRGTSRRTTRITRSRPYWATRAAAIKRRSRGPARARSNRFGLGPSVCGNLGRTREPGIGAA